jgi:hypothetical protein
LAGTRSRLYEAYASQHAGTGDGEAETSVLRGHIVTQNLTFAARGAAES